MVAFCHILCFYSSSDSFRFRIDLISHRSFRYLLNVGVTSSGAQPGKTNPAANTTTNPKIDPGLTLFISTSQSLQR